METIEVGGERFVSPPVLAAARNVTPHAVRAAIKAGHIPAREMLGRWLIPLAAAEAWQPQPGRGGARPGSGRPRKDTVSK